MTYVLSRFIMFEVLVIRKVLSLLFSFFFLARRAVNWTHPLIPPASPNGWLALPRLRSFQWILCVILWYIHICREEKLYHSWRSATVVFVYYCIFMWLCGLLVVLSFSFWFRQWRLLASIIKARFLPGSILRDAATWAWVSHQRVVE